MIDNIHFVQLLLGTYHSLCEPLSKTVHPKFLQIVLCGYIFQSKDSLDSDIVFNLGTNYPPNTTCSKCKELLNVD